MRNFSIIPNSSQSAIEQYSDFLSRDVYCNMQPYDVNDPLFLQQLGVLQAEGIRRAINTNSEVTYSGFQETNASIVDSANFIGNKIGYVTNMLTSSLDKGFGILNNSLVKIDSGIDTTNTHLSNIHSGINTVNTNLSNVNAGIHNVNRNLNALGNVMGQGFTALNKGINTANAQLSTVNQNLNVLGNITAQGFAALSNNLFALRNMVGQGFSILHASLSVSNNLLNNILNELKIPETQRERRFHLEQGVKYLSTAFAKKGDKFYFEDAVDEFTKAIAIERKDFFSWYNLGIIFLRSKELLDISKSIDAFERFVHYAQAEAMHSKNQKLEVQIDEAHLYMAESYYLQQKFAEAISETEQCVLLKDKADFMKVKYLSATNDKNNKQESAKILSQLIDKNPYITLQVLEDDDIVKNDSVIKLLEKLRQDAVKKADSLLSKIKKGLQNSYYIEQTKDVLSEIENLLQKQTFLESYEAIYLMEKEYEWKTRNGILFISTILDFEVNEKPVFEEEKRIQNRIKEIERKRIEEEERKRIEEEERKRIQKRIKQEEENKKEIQINGFENFIGITRNTHLDECIRKFGTPKIEYMKYIYMENGFYSACFNEWLRILYHSSKRVMEINIRVCWKTEIQSITEALNNLEIFDGKISLLGRHRNELRSIFGKPNREDKDGSLTYNENDRKLQIGFDCPDYKRGLCTRIWVHFWE